MIENLKPIVERYKNATDETLRYNIKREIITTLNAHVGTTLTEPIEDWFTNICTACYFYIENNKLQHVPMENMYPQISEK